MKKTYILTGGFGCGKSTVLEILRKKGYQVIEEQARKIIKEIQGDNVASRKIAKKNLVEFQINISTAQRKEEQKITEGVVFIDRSPLDQVIYLELAKKDFSEDVYSLFSKNNYEPIVFFFETPPKEKFGKKGVTFMSYNDSIEFSTIGKQIYKKEGFEIIDVKFDTYENQANLIEKHIKEKK